MTFKPLRKHAVDETYTFHVLLDEGCLRQPFQMGCHPLQITTVHIDRPDALWDFCALTHHVKHTLTYIGYPQQDHVCRGTQPCLAQLDGIIVHGLATKENRRYKL